MNIRTFVVCDIENTPFLRPFSVITKIRTKSPQKLYNRSFFGPFFLLQSHFFPIEKFLTSSPQNKISFLEALCISVHTTNFGLHKVKHSFGVFAQSLRVSGWPQAANQSLKAHWRRQLLRTPQGDCGGPGC